MKCLNDVQVQAVVDGEAAHDVRQHAAACPRCSGRVRDRETLTASIGQAMNIAVNVPPVLSRRVEQALTEGSTHGATRLRSNTPRRLVWRRAAWSGAALATATLVTIVFVAPVIRGPATVSAAEILAKSVSQLTAGVTDGVEHLEYELTLDGVPREMMPDHVDGTYRVRQIIDHTTAGRYLVATYDASGALATLVAQDPATRRRTLLVRLNEQPFRFEFTLPEQVTLSPPEIERLHMEAAVAMMQVGADQRLQVIETSTGRQYRIEVPRLTAVTPNAVWDLTEAQVVVDASDYHIVEFAVKGAFLRQPYSVSYRLISRTIAAGASVDVAEFEVPRDPREITIEGEGSAIPGRDVVVVALRELARAKQVR
jgi:hypothetical protein